MPQLVRDEFEEYFQNAPLPGTEEVPVEETPQVETSAPPEEPLVAGTEVPQQEDWEQRYKSFQGVANQQLAAQEARIKELERLLAQSQQPPPAESESQPPSPEPTTPEGGESSSIFPPEAQKAIEDFIAEYPEIAQPVSLLLTKVQKETAEEVERRLNEVVQKVEAKIGDIDGFKQGVQAELASQKIATKHPDFMEILTSGQLEQWIQSQPPDVQQELMRLANSPNPNDAVALLDQFKSAVQQQPQSAGGQQAPPEQPQATPQAMSNPKLQATEAVPSRVAAQKTAPAATFDEAFEEAIKGLSKK